MRKPFKHSNHYVYAATFDKKGTIYVASPNMQGVLSEFGKICMYTFKSKR